MKRILIFSLAYYPKFIGGDGVAIKEITDRIDEGDIEFHMVTSRFDSTLPKTEKIGHVMIHRVGWGKAGANTAQTFTPLFYLSKMFFVPMAAYTALRLHQKLRFDAFWAMMAYMLLPIVLLRCVGVRVPHVLTLQEGDPYERVFGRMRIWPFLPLLDYGFRSAAIVQVISNFLGTWARKRGYRGTIEVIPNAVDIPHFTKTVREQELNEVRDALGKKMGDVFLITTSRLVEKNAVDDVVRALALLPENVRFIILGTGPDEEKIRRIVHEVRVEERVTFLGHIDHKELPKYLKASDIFIRPSRSEGFGNSFVEAMAAGLPVIATQEGGIADFLFDETRDPDRPITGYAVDKNSPEQIRDAVLKVMREPEKVRAVVATAGMLVREKYDWTLITRLMRERVFARLLFKSGGAQAGL